MVLQIFISLMIMSVLPQSVKIRSRGWDIFLLGITAYILYWLNHSIEGKIASSYLLEWLPYKGFKANLNLSTTKELCKLLLPLLGMILFLMYQNIVYRKDNSPQNYNAMLLMAVPFFILLYNSKDFVQLLSGSCFFTLFSFYLINQPEAREKSLYYCFFAEMCLFTALAIVFSGLDNINISSFGKYLKKARHKDLIAVLVLAAVFAKSGLFLFQNKLLDLQKMSFSRIMVFYFLGNPLSGLVLFVILKPLWNSSQLSEPIILTIVTLSILWGFFGALLMDSLKAKALYLNLMFYAFYFALLYHNQTYLSMVITYMLPLQLLLNYLLYMVILSASDEIYVSEMGGFWKPLKFNLILGILGIMTWSAFWLKFTVIDLAIYFYIFGGVVLVVFAHIFYQVYFAPLNADEYVYALLKNLHWGLMVPLFVGLIWGVSNSEMAQNIYFYAGVLAWIIFCRLGVFRILNRFNDSDFVQDSDLLHKIYSLFIIAPIRILGRILWLSIDFVIIERTIIGSISETTGMLVRGLQRVQSTAWLNYLFMLLLGLGIIFICVGYQYE